MQTALAQTQSKEDLLHNQLVDLALWARQSTTTLEQAISLYIHEITRFGLAVSEGQIQVALQIVERELAKPDFRGLIGCLIEPEVIPPSEEVSRAGAIPALVPQPMAVPRPEPAPVLRETPTPTEVSRPAAPQAAPEPRAVAVSLSLKERYQSARSAMERGDVFAQAINRHKEISPHKFRCARATAGNQISIYEIEQVVEEGGVYLDPKKILSLANYFKVLGLANEGAEIAIIARHGHIAIEVPSESHTVIQLDELLDQAISEVRPGDPLKAWIGISPQRGLVEFDFSISTGFHMSIAGMSGGGKSGLINTLFSGMILRQYKPWFVKFIVIDIQEVNAQCLESFYPWFWKDLGIISKCQDIAELLRFAPKFEDESDDKKKPPVDPGLLQLECDRRKEFYKRVRAGDLDSYNRKAYQEYLVWRDERVLTHETPDQISIEAYNQEAEAEYTRWESVRAVQSRYLGLPPILEHLIILIDEVAAIKDAFGTAGHRFSLWLQSIAQELRKFGFHLFCCTQRAAADSNGPYTTALRGQFGYGICLKVKEGSTSEMVLGKDNHMATQLAGAGDCYVVTPKSTEPMRVQLFYTPPDLVDAIAEEVMMQYHPRTMRTITQIQEQIGGKPDGAVMEKPKRSLLGSSTPAREPPVIKKVLPPIRAAPAIAELPQVEDEEVVLNSTLDAKSSSLSIYQKVLEVRQTIRQEFEEGRTKAFTKTEFGGRVFGTKEFRSRYTLLEPLIIAAITKHEAVVDLNTQEGIHQYLWGNA